MITAAAFARSQAGGFLPRCCGLASPRVCTCGRAASAREQQARLPCRRASSLTSSLSTSIRRSVCTESWRERRRTQLSPGTHARTHTCTLARTRVHTRAQTHARTRIRKHARARTHARMHAHTQARTRTHARAKGRKHIAPSFPVSPRLRGVRSGWSPTTRDSSAAGLCARSASRISRSVACVWVSVSCGTVPAAARYPTAAQYPTRYGIHGPR